MIVDKLHALRQTPLFAGLADDELRELAELSPIERHHAGTTLFREHDPGGTMYVVVSGEVEIYVRDRERHEVQLLKVTPGRIFGEMSVLDNRPRSASARALTDVALLTVSRETLMDVARQRSAVAIHLLELLSERLRSTSAMVQDRVVPNATEAIEVKRTLSDRISDFFTSASGNLYFVLFSLLWFTVWIALNIGAVPGMSVFDPFPFGLLTMIVSLEMVFLSLFILIKQERQAANDKVRDDIEYEVNVRAEIGIRNLTDQIEAMELRLSSRLNRLEQARTPTISPLDTVVSRVADERTELETHEERASV
jgi:CRP-like cAMP-binding protein